jgi:hypothetical protein
MMPVATILKSLPTTSVLITPFLSAPAGGPKPYRREETVGNVFGGVQFLPSTFYIGRDGKVVDKVFGLKKRNEIEEDIKRALAQGALAQGQVTQARN